MKNLSRANSHRHPLDMIADANALISGLALYPQLITIAVTKNVNGIAVLTFLFIALNSFIWVLFAVHRRLLPLLLSSLLNLLAAGGIIVFVLLHGSMSF